MSKRRSYRIYKFNELTKTAKEKAIADWYDREDYPFLSEDLTESCKALLEAAKIKVIDGPKLLYSLSWSQGDGLCFTGVFTYKKRTFVITHSARYYYAKSVDIHAEEDSTTDKQLEAFDYIYQSICAKLEKEGYSIIEYRMEDIEFNEHCNSNDYWFTKDGKLD